MGERRGGERKRDREGRGRERGDRESALARNGMGFGQLKACFH